VIAVGVPLHVLDVAVQQPQSLGHEALQRTARGALRQPDAGLEGLLGHPGALLQHRVGEPHDALHAGARRGGHLLRRLAGPDPGLDHPRGQLGAEVDVDLGEPAGIAARGGADAVVDGQLELLAVAGVPAVGGEDEALPVVGERHETQ
jgi:hypothetical protein